MKNISKIGFLVISSVLFLASIAYTKDLKIGVVDVEKIYSEYEKAKRAREEIQGKRTEKQVELSKKQAELQRLVNEYNEKKGKLKEAEMKEYEKKINDLTTEINTFVRLTNQQLIDENRRKTQVLLNEIAKVIQEYATKNNYDLIVDKKSLPYFSNSFDISEEIIKILNQKTK